MFKVFKHRNVVSGSPLEDPKGATLRHEKGNALTCEDSHGKSEESIAPSGDRAEPQVVETSELDEAYRAVAEPEGPRLAAERSAGPCVRPYSPRGGRVL